MTKIIDVKIRVAKIDVGTDKSFLKSKFSQEIVNNGEKCGWLKQMLAVDEKHDSNK